MRPPKMVSFGWLAGLALIAVGCGPEEVTVSGAADTEPTVVQPIPAMMKLAIFPERTNPACGNGRAKIYDECGDQQILFDAAFSRAKADNKVLLVSYGAEWCIWCHVFDQYIAGRFEAFEYQLPEETRSMRERRTETMAQEATQLNRYVGDNFVVLHIESDNAPGGWEVLEATGADAHIENWVPFIFTVTSDGKFAATLDHERVELPTIPILMSYRGYDRVKLLEQLRQMADAARSQAG